MITILNAAIGATIIGVWAIVAFVIAYMNTKREDGIRPAGMIVENAWGTFWAMPLITIALAITLFVVTVVCSMLGSFAAWLISLAF